MDRKLFQASYFDMIVLKLLRERDMYGYEIIEEISSRSENICDIKAGTLYPILASLTEQGWIEPYEKPTEQKRIRKYYKITLSGIHALEDKKENWQNYCQLINGLIGP
ncbi:MAG: PadR family transcriptional regulator [Eubacterium sp.]|nr:PadR family transcriptional regulator [Eubacterium sp.]MCM1214844.1 PadR family transcriptional regulator [Lachnospiraceae bacterium]MCM1238920.1 PadR family transcriptional regulator [Lachnospiraceae bacterium]